MEVGELITLYRKQAGLTIDELSEKSGVPKGTINKIIGGTTKAPTLPNMKAIAAALGKTLADFDDLPTKEEKQSANTDELPRDVERIIQILRAVPDNQKNLAFDLTESVLLSLLRHLPIAVEEQYVFLDHSNH